MKKNRVLIMTLVASLLVIVSAVAIWMIFFRDPTDRFEPKYQQTTEDATQGTKESVKESKQDEGVDLPELSSEVPGSTAGTISITELDQSRGFVNVGVSVADFETKRCVYSFTSEGARPVVRELNKCENISIPEIEFEKIGSYTLTVTAYDSELKIESKRDISIR